MQDSVKGSTKVKIDLMYSSLFHTYTHRHKLEIVILSQKETGCMTQFILRHQCWLSVVFLNHIIIFRMLVNQTGVSNLLQAWIGYEIQDLWGYVWAAAGVWAGLSEWGSKPPHNFSFALLNTPDTTNWLQLHTPRQHNGATGIWLPLTKGMHFW